MNAASRHQAQGPGRVSLQVAFSVLLVLSTLGTVLAQSGAPFDLRRSTIDGGGGRSSGGSLQVTGTIGQPDVGRSSGGSFVLRGGFWAGPAAESTIGVLFADGFE